MPNRFARLLAVLLACLVSCPGCGEPEAQRSRRSTRGSGRRIEGDALLASVAATLNDLPQRSDLNLAPAEPILTATSSADGKEVRAIITENPAAPETGFNFLRLTTGNASLKSLGVQPLDVVRIFTVQVGDDEESRQEFQQMQEMGIERLGSIEIPIRRLDLQSPDDSLLLDGALNQSVDVPQRIEIWRYSDKRTRQIDEDLKRYEAIRQPPLGWEPTPDKGELQRLVEGANKWLRNIAPNAEPRPVAEQLKTLPGELRQAKGVAELLAPAQLGKGLYAEYEGRLLQQAVWIRDIAQWARGSAISDADTAAALAEWVVRNIQLDDAAAARTVHFPWQALAYGHGSAEHRSWTLVELCRQLRIPAVLFAFAPAADAPPKRTLVGVQAEEGWLLFDMEYGLALPGEKGAATLAEWKANPDLTRAFDLPDAPYPLTAEDVSHVTALMVASPLQLSWRASALEDALKGEQLVFLAADPVVSEKRLKGAPIDATKLWPAPFAAIAESYATRPSTRAAEVAQFAPFAAIPQLWKARSLHFQGHKDVPREQRDDPLATPTEGHREATKLYQDKLIIPSDAALAALDPSKRPAAIAAKQAASYWLGLLMYDLGEFDAARWWLDERTLQTGADNGWLEGARYNLARAMKRLAVASPEGAGELVEQAVRLLKETPRESPQWAGNQVLAEQWEAESR